MFGLVADAGIKRIQVASFMHPKPVPQMADAEEICQGLDYSRDVLYSGLVLNIKGLERAAKAGRWRNISVNSSQVKCIG